jgi:glycosyltransferase involved in cell wall biosynthesis
VRLLFCDPEAKQQRGGLSIALQRVAKALQDTRFDVWQVERQPGRWAAHCPGQPTQQAKGFAELLDCLQPDLVVGVGWHTWSEEAVRVAHQSGIQTVFWSHGVGCLTWYAARPLLALLRWCWRAPRVASLAGSLRRVNHLVVAYARRSALDSRSADEGLARRLFATPVSVIGNPVDTTFWKPAMAPHACASAVLSVGRLEWQKGHATALSIVMSTTKKGLEFGCLAPAMTPYRQVLERQIGQRDDTMRLQFHIGLDAVQRRQLLQQALCLISWSETEYQSLAILEAMACGCPVIARPRGWLVQQPIPGVLVTNRQAQASDWLLALLRDANWAKQLGLAGRHYVEEQHALPVVGHQWSALFQRLLERP